MYKKYNKIKNKLDEIMKDFHDKNRNLSISTCRLYALEIAVNQGLIKDWQIVNTRNNKCCYYGSIGKFDNLFLVILNE